MYASREREGWGRLGWPHSHSLCGDQQKRTWGQERELVSGHFPCSLHVPIPRTVLNKQEGLHGGFVPI